MDALPAAVLCCIVLLGCVQDSVADARLAAAGAAVCVAGLAAACLATRRHCVLNVVCFAPADTARLAFLPSPFLRSADLLEGTESARNDLGPETTTTAFGILLHSLACDLHSHSKNTTKSTDGFEGRKGKGEEIQKEVSPCFELDRRGGSWAGPGA